MNTRQADKVIKANSPVTVKHNPSNERFVIHIVKRDRYLLYTADGGVFDRDELTVIK